MTSTVKAIRTFAMIALVLSSERVDQKDSVTSPVEARRRNSSNPLKEPWHLKVVMGLLWANAGVALLLTVMGCCGAKDPDDGYAAGVLEGAVPVLAGITALIVVLAVVTTRAKYNVHQAFDEAKGDVVSFYAVEPLLEAGQHTLKRVLTSGGVRLCCKNREA